MLFSLFGTLPPQNMLIVLENSFSNEWLLSSVKVKLEVPTWGRKQGSCPYPEPQVTTVYSFGPPVCILGSAHF